MIIARDVHAHKIKNYWYWKIVLAEYFKTIQFIARCKTPDGILQEVFGPTTAGRMD
jgi:tartrate dehydratase beta subunit/fumarate hydratase class I family protein